MQHLCYAIYDQKVNCYHFPYFVAHPNVALRAFAIAANNKELDIGRFPEDFDLYEVGTYDDETATFGNLPERKFIAKASQFVQVVPQTELPLE
jgi:hypothetical protein